MVLCFSVQRVLRSKDSSVLFKNSPLKDFPYCFGVTIVEVEQVKSG